MKTETPRCFRNAMAATVLEMRARSGLGCRALAQRARVSHTSISRAERGESNPSAAWLWRVAGNCGCSLRDAGELVDMVTARAPDTLEEAREMVRGYMDVQKRRSNLLDSLPDY